MERLPRGHLCETRTWLPRTRRTYDATSDATFAAAERAVERVGMKVKEADIDRGVVRATTGMTIRSWGERVEIAVTSLGASSTSVTVSISLKFQVFGWVNSNEWPTACSTRSVGRSRPRRLPRHRSCRLRHLLFDGLCLTGSCLTALLDGRRCPGPVEARR